MNSDLGFLLYIIFISFAVLCSIIRYKILDFASRILTTLMILSLISEFIAEEFAKRYHNNMPVYHFYAPLQLLIICAYFNYAINEFRVKNLGWYIGMFGVFISIVCSVFVQPLKSLNSYFLLIEGFIIISICLYAFYKILDNDNIGALNNPHFWFSFILLFFWSVTYINWSLYKILGQEMIELMPFIGVALWVINAITYVSYGLVFMFYPTKKSIN